MRKYLEVQSLHRKVLYPPGAWLKANDAHHNRYPAPQRLDAFRKLSLKIAGSVRRAQSVAVVASVA
jgi:hypothetical protein